MNREDILKKIGQSVRELREAKNYSLQEFSDKLDMEYNNLIRIEKGRSNFTIGTLVKIANALEVELKELIP